MKQYKACAPEQTIGRIRGILTELGIFLKESGRQNGDELFSCRLSAVNDGLESLDIGTNGKGRSYLYSLASGYAEFMERLQSGYRFEFKIEPAATRNIDQIWDEWQKEIRQFTPDADTLERARQLFGANLDTECIPVEKYLCAGSGETVLLPESLLIDSSNGLAAGNTPSEAILQGCCEIFERYAVRRIYFDRLTPPDIPLETFRGTAAARIIRQLETEKGLRVTVKDCSLGEGLPVVGVLLVDEKMGKYNFGFGSDFNIHIALERTLTEHYQGGCGLYRNPQDVRHVREEELSSENIANIYRNADGQWPDSIFADQPSWQFAGLNPDYGQSDEQDLLHCLDICQSHDTQMYVRDHSFLGFPTFRIIIPAMSATNFGLDYLYHNRLFRFVNLRRKLLADGEVTAESLIEVVEPWARRAVEKGTKFDLCKLIPAYENADLRLVTPRIFLALAALHRRDRAQALSLLEEECRAEDSGVITITDKDGKLPVPANRFANALADWLALTGEKATTSLSLADAQKRALGILTRKYGQGFALKAAIWLSRPEDCIRNSGLLSHFQRQNFTLEAPGRRSASSHLEAYEKISARLAERAAAFRPDYAKLAEIFR